MKGIAHYAPERNAPCPCGSGNKFKKCCQGTYQTAHHALARKKYNQGHYEEALAACRSHLCWYVLCHEAHTVPFLKSGTKEAFELLTIDIEALGGAVELLYLCYHKAEIIDEFPASLDRLSQVVNDPRWSAKIAYFHGLWWLVQRGDSAKAYKALHEVDISHCTDPDILALYLDVAPEKLSLPDKVSIVDRICSNTEKASDRLQYGTVKGVAYCLICDKEKGCEAIKSAIEQYRASPAERQTSYGDYQLARALYAIGALSGDESFIEESVKEFHSLIRTAGEHEFSKEILSDLYCSLGECYAFVGKSREAIESYDASLRLDPRPITKIFLAKVYVIIGLDEKGEHLLDEVDVAALSPVNHCDYAIAHAMLAASTKTPAHLERAKSELKKAQPKDPLFIQQRDRWIIELLESAAKDDAGAIRKFIRRLNRYVLLEPNVFGIGLNINRMVDDVSDIEK